jgi:hypothetical protein
MTSSNSPATPLFKKRHYEWIAETIRTLDTSRYVTRYVYLYPKMIRHSISKAFAEQLAKDNPKFDIDKFYTAIDNGDTP